MLEKHIGKLVVVSHWSDFDPADEVRVGILEKVEGNCFYIAGTKRGYMNCRLVGRLLTKRVPDFSKAVSKSQSKSHESKVIRPAKSR